MASAFRKLAKLMHVPVFAAAILSASSSAAFASAFAEIRTPAQAIQKTVSVAAKTSEFAKEQAMSPAKLIDRWTPFIKEASRRFGVAEAWIKAVMRMESGGRTLLADSRPIKSDAGAMGIMQIMPDTYKDMRQQYGLGGDPYDPRDNVLAGAAYLRWLHGKYGYPKMFAAYNAGPGTLDAQAAGARELPHETLAYISGIAHLLGDESIPSEFSSPQAVNSPPQPVDPIATLTRPDGSPVAIEGAAVDAIRAPLSNEYVASVQTVIAMGHKRQGVREDLATVASLIRRHGGKI